MAKYLQSETVADLYYVTCFCSVYAWILIKYKLHFDFLVVFTPLLRPCQLLYHVSLLEPAFLFFVLSGRPLPVTTFFVFSKPPCSHFAAQIVIREFSAPLPKRCLSLSKGFPLQPKFAAAAAQCFYSSFVALLEAILQRCSSAARFVRVSPPTPTCSSSSSVCDSFSLSLLLGFLSALYFPISGYIYL